MDSSWGTAIFAAVLGGEVWSAGLGALLEGCPWVGDVEDDGGWFAPLALGPCVEDG